MDQHYVEIYSARVIRANVESVFSIGKLVGTNKYRLSVNPEGERGTSVDLTFDTLAECFTAVQTHNAGDGDEGEGIEPPLPRVRNDGLLEPEGDDGHGGFDG